MMPEEPNPRPIENRASINVGNVGRDFTGNVAGRDINIEQVHGDKKVFLGPTIIYETLAPPLPPAKAQDHRNLSILLNKVKSLWIEGVLRKSLYNAVLLELDKEMDIEAVEHPWERVLELPDQNQYSLPSDKKIIDIFEDMNRM